MRVSADATIQLCREQHTQVVERAAKTRMSLPPLTKAQKHQSPPESSPSKQDTSNRTDLNNRADSSVFKTDPNARAKSSGETGPNGGTESNEHTDRGQNGGRGVPLSHTSYEMLNTDSFAHSQPVTDRTAVRSTMFESKSWIQRRPQSLRSSFDSGRQSPAGDDVYLCVLLLTNSFDRFPFLHSPAGDDVYLCVHTSAWRAGLSMTT